MKTFDYICEFCGRLQVIFRPVTDKTKCRHCHKAGGLHKVTQ